MQVEVVDKKHQKAFQGLLKQIENRTFDQTQINVSGWGLTDLGLAKLFEALGGNPDLQNSITKLDLSNNNLARPDFATLSKLSILEELDCEQNNIFQFPKMSHLGLRVLNVSENLIGNLFQNDLGGMPKLVTLVANSNQIQSPIAFKLPGTLTELYLRDNKLRSLPQINWEQIKKLDISGNLINDFDQGKLIKLPTVYLKLPKASRLPVSGKRQFKTYKLPTGIESVTNAALQNLPDNSKLSRQAEEENRQFSVMKGKKGKNYSLSHRAIAEGGCGRIKFVVDALGQIHVAKVVNVKGVVKKNLNPNNPILPSEFKQFCEVIEKITENEIAIMDKLGLLEDVVDLERSGYKTFYIIMPWYNQPDLKTWLDALAQSQQSISPNTLFTILGKLADKLQWLEKNNIVHNDFTNTNVLIDPKTLDLQVIDFGLSLDNDDSSRDKARIINLLKKDDVTAKEIERTPKSDIFSAGHLIQDLVSLSTLEDKLAKEIKDYAELMINPDPDKRPTASALKDKINEFSVLAGIQDLTITNSTVSNAPTPVTYQYDGRKKQTPSSNRTDDVQNLALASTSDGNQNRQARRRCCVIS